MLGPVNMKAIEDYEEFKKDYDEFRVKVEKLREEKRSIMNMIEELEEKRRKVFLDTLYNLSKRFQEVYDELVGGYAELKLEDENNIESGLIIEVRPKNQKLVTIDGLSGGEKTMVAVAFLFAVQRYKPYPFYALDEVDAALDPINSEKIGDLILKYSETSQFIVISHNDITVKKAKRIYGVVKEKGTSRIFGVEFDENGKLVLKKKK
jgi:chromosome segregation protein